MPSTTIALRVKVDPTVESTIVIRPFAAKLSTLAGQGGGLEVTLKPDPSFTHTPAGDDQDMEGIPD